MATLEDGYRMITDALYAHRARIVEVLRALDPVIRIVVRPTQVYSDCLRKISIPELCMDSQSRSDAIRSHLNSVGTLFDYDPIEAELASLESLDFPLFTVRASEVAIGDCALISSVSSVESALNSTSNRSVISKQLEIIRQIYDAAYYDPESEENRRFVASVNITSLSILESDHSGAGVDRGLLEEAVVHGIRKIVEKAWTDSGGSYWHNSLFLDGMPRVVASKYCDLYSGKAGTVLALALMNRVRQVDRVYSILEHYAAHRS